MDGNKLLIVEDSEPVAQLLAMSLSARFGEIHFVTALAAARRRIRLVDGAPFDFVICGLTMPDGCGREFHRWLDAYHAPRRLPFVLLAGSLPGLRRPASDVTLLAKPFQMAELTEALADARVRAIQPRPPAGPGERIPPCASGLQG